MELHHCEVCGTLLDQHFFEFCHGCRKYLCFDLTGKEMAVQNLIPIILGIIIVKLAWMTSFFAEIVANTGRHEAVFHSRTISAKNAKIDKAMSNIKAKSSNQMPSSNAKSPNPSLLKGGEGGLSIDTSTALSINPEQTPGFRPGNVEGLILEFEIH